MTIVPSDRPNLTHCIFYTCTCEVIEIEIIFMNFHILTRNIMLISRIAIPERERER